MAERQQLGAWGEQLATIALEKKGYQIIARNWHSSYGEVDIIAQCEQLQIFVEVKTRRGRRFGSPEQAIDRRKAERMVRVVQAYRLAHPETADFRWRVDLMAIELDKEGKLLRCDHIEQVLPQW